MFRMLFAVIGIAFLWTGIVSLHDPTGFVTVKQVVFILVGLIITRKAIWG